MSANNYTCETENYDWVDRRLQEMVDAEKREPKEQEELQLEFHDWVDRKLQEMANAEFNQNLYAAEKRHNFTYEEVREYHQQRNLQRKFICSLH